jgi:hypothetical protein
MPPEVQNEQTVVDVAAAASRLVAQCRRGTAPADAVAALAQPVTADLLAAVLAEALGIHAEQQFRLVRGIGVRARLNGRCATVRKRSGGGWVEVEVEGERFTWRSGHWEPLPVVTSASPLLTRCSLFASIPSATLRAIFAQLPIRELGLISGTSKATAAALRNMPVDVDIWACVPENDIGATSLGSNVRFMSFLAWVIRHQLKPRSFRAHLAPADLLALDALSLQCGSDALTSMDLRLGVPGHSCMQSMLVPDPNAEFSTGVDLTESTSKPSMSSAERAAQWQRATVSTIRHSLRHRPSAIPTVASVLSRFTRLEILSINVSSGIMSPADLLEALRLLHCLQTLKICLKTNHYHIHDYRNLTLPELPSLRELYVIGGASSFLKVASPTLCKLDCTASGKELRLHLECPRLQDVHLPNNAFPFGYGPFVVPFAGHFPCIFPHMCSSHPELCSISGHTSCTLDHDVHHHASNCRGHFGRTYVVGESCEGLWSPGDHMSRPTTSGPGSLWRIPDGVRVTIDS